MTNFPKQQILEKILEQAPVQTNLKGKIIHKGKQIVIYAYYNNSGIMDPEPRVRRISSSLVRQIQHPVSRKIKKIIKKVRKSLQKDTSPEVQSQGIFLFGNE